MVIISLFSVKPLVGFAILMVFTIVKDCKVIAQKNANTLQQLRTISPSRTVFPPPFLGGSMFTTNAPLHGANDTPTNYRFNVEEARLHEFVLRGYTEMIRPAKNPNETVFVITRIFPMKIQEIIEKDEVLHLSIRIQFGWTDKRLAWNPNNFSGLKTDLQFVNSADDMYGILGMRQFAVKVHYNGEIWWHPTGSLKLRCELDLQLFPYDHQRCKVIIESVIFTHEQLNLTIRRDKAVSFSMYRDNGLWEVTNGYGEAMLDWATSQTAFSRVEFTLHMQRRTSYYVNNYIIPCFLLSCLQVLTFLIPLKNPERLTHATSVLLSLIVFQTIIFSELPKTASSMPLLARYLMALSIVSVLAIASCVSVSYLLALAENRAQKNATLQVPIFVLKVLNLQRVEKSSTILNNLSRHRGVSFDCSPTFDANPVRECNGHAISRHQHRIMREENCETHKKSKRNCKGTVRAAQFYRHLAEQIDLMALFVCSIAILCVPFCLFVIAPAVTIPDPKHVA